MSEREPSHALARSRRHRLIALAVVGSLIAAVGIVVSALRLASPPDPLPDLFTETLAFDATEVWWSAGFEDEPAAGAPGSVERIRWVLTEVEWTDEQVVHLARGLVDSRAVLADAAPGRWQVARERARAVLEATSDPATSVDMRLQGAVLTFLEPWTGAMAALLRRSVIAEPPVEPPGGTSPEARLPLALGHGHPVDALDPWLTSAEVLAEALRNLGGDVAAADDFVRDYLAWILPLAIAEAAASPGQRYRPDSVGEQWLDPAASMARDLAVRRCTRGTRTSSSCVHDVAAQPVLDAAWRTTYEAVPLSLVPPALVADGERRPWDTLDPEQLSLVAQGARDGTFPYRQSVAGY